MPEKFNRGPSVGFLNIFTKENLQMGNAVAKSQLCNDAELCFFFFNRSYGEERPPATFTSLETVVNSCTIINIVCCQMNNASLVNASFDWFGEITLEMFCF